MNTTNPFSLSLILIIETLADGQERVLESRSHPSPIAYLETDQVAQENLQ